MSSLNVPRPALSLPVNETAQLSPKHSPRDPSKTFSRIISHLKFEHDNSSQKLQVPKSSSTRPFSTQNCDVQTFLAETPRVKTPRPSIREASKIDSTIMSHFTLPASDPTSCESTPRVSYIDPAITTIKPTAKVKNNKQASLDNPPGSEHIVHPTAQTRYVDMLLGLDEVPRSHNLLAAFSTWILLAGFIVVPGTFVSIEHSKTLQQGAKNSKVAHAFLDTVKHASLIFVASLCCGMGSAGMVWLWWRWRHNYVWLINKIFLVGLLNSVAGLLSTLINVYSQHGGRFSITAKITVWATASCTVITAILYFLYNFWILQGVRKKHEQELELEAGKRATLYKPPVSE